MPIAFPKLSDDSDALKAMLISMAGKLAQVEALYKQSEAEKASIAAEKEACRQ